MDDSASMFDKVIKSCNEDADEEARLNGKAKSYQETIF